MKKIPLKKRFGGIDGYTLVDDDVYAWASRHDWHRHDCGRGVYAMRSLWNGGKGKKIYLHREIAKPGDGLVVDHINGNGLDNRRSNLRVCTHRENLTNRGKMRNNTSGYKCVYHDKKRGYFQAYITVNGKRHHLGNFKTAAEAHAWYAEIETAIHGEFANVG